MDLLSTVQPPRTGVCPWGTLGPLQLVRRPAAMTWFGAATQCGDAASCVTHAVALEMNDDQARRGAGL